MRPGAVEVTVCVALHRRSGGERRWLLTVRGPEVAHAPGTLGLVGGHLELGTGGHAEPALLEADVLELNARREVREETGLDLDRTRLTYLSSESFRSETGQPVLAVTFVAEVPPGAEAAIGAPDELSEVGWWSLTELAADPRCVPWTLRLCRQADELVSRLSR